MTCRLFGAARFQVWWCEGDMEQRWAESMCDEEQAAWELDEDLRIEAELGPWPSVDGWTEETEVELVPIEAAWARGEEA